jgi:hypothetical protein
VGEDKAIEKDFARFCAHQLILQARSFFLGRLRRKNPKVFLLKLYYIDDIW